MSELKNPYTQPVCTDDSDCFGKCIKNYTLDGRIKRDVGGYCSDINKNNMIKNVIGLVCYLISVLIYSMYLVNGNHHILFGVLTVSTFIIIYSLRINIEESPIIQSKTKMVLPTYNENSVNNSSNGDINISRYDKMKIYNTTQFNKTTLIFVFYFVLILIMYFLKWKKECDYNSLLCNNNILFIFTYFAFSIYLLLDSLKVTNKGFFGTSFGQEIFKYNKSKDILIESHWIVNSLIYCVYLFYILEVGQTLDNTLFGKNSSDLNIFVISSIIMIIINYYQNMTNSKLNDSCDCDRAHISMISNDLNMIQYNSIILTISILIVIFVSKTL
tara:strand:+ start:325 stop:1311 length:987 start_codon:yes stop_codon:yes gene_type:complete